jgi:hypothetical protein
MLPHFSAAGSTANSEFMYPRQGLVTGHDFSRAAKAPMKSLGLQPLFGYSNPENALVTGRTVNLRKLESE